MNSHGIPGPGSSLGQCALCGETFMKEIMLGQSVQTGNIGGYSIAAHYECIKRYVVNGKVDCSQLPVESPFYLSETEAQCS